MDKMMGINSALLTFLLGALLVFRLLLPFLIVAWIVFFPTWRIASGKWPPRKAAFRIVVLPLMIFLVGFTLIYLGLHVRYNLVNRADSSDGHYTLLVESRPDFPMSELLDPRADVRITLSEKKAGRIVQREMLTVEEISDASHSDIKWTPHRVTVDFGRGVLKELELDAESKNPPTKK